MDEIISKIGELQQCASRLKDANRVSLCKQVRPNGEIENLSDEGHGDWLDKLRDSLGTIDEPLVVVSLFDGIGGTWAALNRLNIPFVGYSCEIDENAVQVLKARFPDVKHLGDVKDFHGRDIEEQVDLVVGGFPCQDLSSMGKKMGLHGPKSRLFFDMLRVLHILKPKWFLVENVASMGWVDQEEITKYMKCRAIEIDSQYLTASRRRRLYWTNIPHPVTMPDSKVVLQDHLDNAQALEQNIGVILSCNHFIGGKGQLQCVYCLEKREMRYITITEVEKIMGFPPGHTNINFFEDSEDRAERKMLKNIRWGLLGNSFSVAVISYLLSPLLNPSVWETRKPHEFSENYQEKQCSVMESGEVWALYNDQRQPNWYAVINSVGGDRFAISSTSKEKKPLKIQVRFLELHSAYGADDWNPTRGTGLYKLLDEIDPQESWVAFSHKINVSKVDGLYFIYPREGEIWAVFDPHARQPTPYFVYVNNSDVTLNEPGKEIFCANCTLLQKVDKELFRCTEVKLDCKNLSQFYYSVPYHFKSKAGIFKLELNQRSWTYMDDGSRPSGGFGRGRRRKRKRLDSSDDDEEDNDEEENEGEICAGEQQKREEPTGGESERSKRMSSRRGKKAPPTPKSARKDESGVIDLLDSD